MGSLQNVGSATLVRHKKDPNSETNKHMAEEIVNKVKQQTKLVTLDLEKLVGDTEIREFDLKEFLFMEMILKEKDFREKLADHDWSQYEGVCLAVRCSTDAILPKWAFMLVVQYASPHALDIFEGSKEEAALQLFEKRLHQTDWSLYTDKFVLLKGCSKMNLPERVYMEATKCLLPYVKKLMYGEACSNVPVYSRKPVKS